MVFVRQSLENALFNCDTQILINHSKFADTDISHVFYIFDTQVLTIELKSSTYKVLTFSLTLINTLVLIVSLLLPSNLVWI